MDGTERERAASRASNSNCRPCHAKFDPFGLAFERYDALGRYHETRQAVLDSTTGLTAFQTSATPIDASAVLPDDGKGDMLAGPIDGVNELAAKLAGAGPRVALCASRRLAEYALGYNPDAERSCELKAVKETLVETGSFTAFFRALVLSPGFPHPQSASGGGALSERHGATTMSRYISTRLSRRSFFTGLGAGVAHVFLRPLLAEADGIIPQRLLMIHRPCGTWPDEFLPARTQPAGTGYPMTPILEPFEALRHKMVVFRGVDGPPNNTQNGDRHGAGLIGQVTGRLAVQPATASVRRPQRHEQQEHQRRLAQLRSIRPAERDRRRAAARPAGPGRSISRATPVRDPGSTSPAWRPSATRAPRSPSSASPGP